MSQSASGERSLRSFVYFELGGITKQLMIGFATCFPNYGPFDDQTQIFTFFCSFNQVTYDFTMIQGAQKPNQDPLMLLKVGTYKHNKNTTTTTPRSTPLFWVKKGEIAEGIKAGRARKTTPPPP